MAKKKKLSNQQLAAMFARLRAEGKLKIRAHHRGLITNIMLKNPRVMIEEAKKRGFNMNPYSMPWETRARFFVGASPSTGTVTYKPRNEIRLAGGFLQDPRRRDWGLEQAGATYASRSTPTHKVLARTHVDDSLPWVKNQRLGTALYLLMYRNAKRRGYAGVYSPGPTHRSRSATKVWGNIKTGTIKSEQYDWDYLTSVRPHAKRRGQKLKAKRNASTTT